MVCKCTFLTLLRDEKVRSLQADLEEQEEKLVNGVYCAVLCVCEHM